MSVTLLPTEEILARLPELLTPERVHAWLLSLPEDEIVGVACASRSCPIQRYLTETVPVGAYWIVGVSRAVAFNADHSEFSFLFKDEAAWITDYIYQIDVGLPMRADISREYALDRLTKFL